jgi:predicted Zn-dependent protease
MKILVAILLVAFLVSCTKSPTGRNQFAFMSDNKLAQMGTESFEQMKKEIPATKNKKLTKFVQCVADSMTPFVSKEAQSGDWEVVVFESEQINAFALPGGKIGVYTGILKVTENQDQLAAIMGHEIGHVIAKHSNERLSSNQAAAGVQALAGALLGSQDEQTKTYALAALGAGLQYGVLMPYGRSHEKEADIIGQDLMAQAGFNPEAAIALWHNMAKASKGAPPEFLSTHPSHDTRIEKLTENLAIAQPIYSSSVKSPRCGS